MRDPIEVLSVSETVESGDVPRLRRMFWDLAIERRFRVVVNLAAADWLCFDALNLLALTARVNRANGGDLVVTAPAAAVRETIRMTGFDTGVRVFDTDREAARYFGFENGNGGANRPSPDPASPETRHLRLPS